MPLDLTRTFTNENDQSSFSIMKHSKHMENFECNPLVKYNRSAVESARFYKRKPGSVYGRLKYKYLGKNSEGNRFIRNADL